MKATRIKSVTFDRHGRPLKAVILTPHGTVQVRWRDVCGGWCWFTSGILDARKLAGPAIERIGRMAESLS
jgi:hypothetical protein